MLGVGVCRLDADLFIGCEHGTGDSSECVFPGFLYCAGPGRAGKFFHYHQQRARYHIVVFWFYAVVLVTLAECVQRRVQFVRMAQVVDY